MFERPAPPTMSSSSSDEEDPDPTLQSLHTQRAKLTDQLGWVKTDLARQKRIVDDGGTAIILAQARHFIREDAASIVSIESALSDINAKIKEEAAARRGEMSAFTEMLLSVINERFGQEVEDSLVEETRARLRASNG